MDGITPYHQAGPKVSFVDRTQRNANARAVAKEAIALLEKHIHDEFGVTVKMGAELEFAVGLHQKNPYFYYHTNPAFKLREKDAVVKAGADPSLIRDETEKCPQFPDSTRVAYGYLDENGISEHWDTVEFILSHEPCDSQGLPIKRPMAALAREIDALIKQVCQPARGYKNPPTSFDHHEGALHWQRFHRDEVKEIRAQSYLAEENMAFGLHLNFSLWDQDGKSWNLRSDHREFANQMHESTCRIFAENMALLAETYNARTRIKRQYHDGSLPAFEHHFVGNTSRGYYENKICGIDADPYFAVMLQLAAIYEGLDEFRVSQPKPVDEAEPIVHKEAYASRRLSMATMMDAQTHKEDFANMRYNKLPHILNSLQPQLGSRFIEAFTHKEVGQHGR